MFHFDYKRQGQAIQLTNALIHCSIPAGQNLVLSPTPIMFDGLDEKNLNYLNKPADLYEQIESIAPKCYQELGMRQKKPSLYTVRIIELMILQAFMQRYKPFKLNAETIAHNVRWYEQWKNDRNEIEKMMTHALHVGATIGYWQYQISGSGKTMYLITPNEMALKPVQKVKV